MKTFLDLLNRQSFQGADWQVRGWVESQLADLNLSYKVDFIGNIIVEKGSPPFPTFSAHMDTVHELTPDYKVETLHREDQTIFTSKTGIGGDDKCGVWICLQLLRRLPSVKVIFTVQEEYGQIGAENLDLSELEKSAFICGIDRQGNRDIITEYFFMPTVSDTFKRILKYVAPGEWKMTEGMITDVFVWAEHGSQISTINLSCGFYNPHRKDEYIIWEDVLETLELATELARVAGRKTYEFDFEDDTLAFYDPMPFGLNCKSQKRRKYGA